MEKDIQNYSPTVMFRGTPCSFYVDIRAADGCGVYIDVFIPSAIPSCFIQLSTREQKHFAENLLIKKSADSLFFFNIFKEISIINKFLWEFPQLSKIVFFWQETTFSISLMQGTGIVKIV